MPELGEVAHAVAQLRKYVLGKTISKVTAAPDDLLYVKPLTNEVFKQATEGSKVTKVSRNGKYFMVELNGSKTLVLHFGMTGWIYVKNVGTLIRMEGGGDRKQKEQIELLEKDGKDPKLAHEMVENWPPRFTKFAWTSDGGDDVAFTDPRRLGRVRLLDVPESEAHELEPLSKLGTDFSQHQPPSSEVVPLILKRKVPVKSLLLDQTIFSGIGNWMADEILFQARLHPAQYADTLSESRAKELYDSLLEVSKIAAETEGNSAAFPKHWLMLHRWGKSRSKKEVQKTADGHIVDFVKVGGRTSCFVPDLQKKLSKNVKEEAEEPNEELKEELKEEPNGAKDATPKPKRVKKEQK